MNAKKTVLTGLAAAAATLLTFSVVGAANAEETQAPQAPGVNQSADVNGGGTVELGDVTQTNKGGTTTHKTYTKKPTAKKPGLAKTGYSPA